MITYNPKSWIKLIFAIQKSDTLRLMWKELLFISLFSLGLAYVIPKYFHHLNNLDKLFQVYSVIGFVISLLLVFRTNTAYDRWWEGRKIWGQLVNDTRNLSIKLHSLKLPLEEKIYFADMIVNFVFAMKEHLRNGVDFETLTLSKVDFEELQNSKHVPLKISSKMYNRLHELKQKNVLSEAELLILDKNLNGLMDACGACERIKNTPIPYSYSLFIKKFIFIYTITLPLAFVTTFGYFTALITTFIFYALASMEVLAEEIEDPFGADDNDLPTDELAEKIKVNIKETLA